MPQDSELSALLALPDIAGFVSQSAFGKAKSYQQQGRVTGVRVSEDLTVIHAKVRGSGSENYKVEIRLDIADGQVRDIDGDCSCPVGYNCKHVAATLMEVLAQGGQATFTARPAQANVPARVLSSAERAKPVAALPHHLEQWLTGLSRVAAGDDYPPEVNQRLLYVFKAGATHDEMPHLAVEVLSVRLLKTGEWSPQVSHANLYNFDPAKAPKFYRSADIDIFAAMARDVRPYSRDNRYPIHSFDLVRRIVGSGRAYWQSHTGEPLQLGEPRQGRIEWVLVSAAGLRPRLVVDGAVGLNAEPPVYIDESAGTIGTVDLDLAPRVAHQILCAPAIAPSMVGQVSSALGSKLPQLRRDLLPSEPEPPIRIDDGPKPVLRLMEGKRSPYTYYYYGTPETLAVARLTFNYGPIEIAIDEERSVVEIFKDGRIYEVKRRPAEEKAFVARLTACDLKPATRVLPGLDSSFREDFAFADSHDWLDFLANDAPDLQALGFDIRIDATFPYQLARPSAIFDAEFESSGIDWFDLDLGIEIDGARLDLAPLLAALVRGGSFDPGAIQAMAEVKDNLYLRLNDGRYLGIAAERYLPIVLALHELNFNGLFIDKNGRLKISRAEAALLLGAETDNFLFKGMDNLRHLARLLGTRGMEPLSLPPGFNAELRPYQAEGVSWLNLLRQSGLGGILADDMGLGKTVQILALLAHEKASGRLNGQVLIVAPTSLMTNWFNEARKFVPDMKVLILQGADRKQYFTTIGGHDIILTTYPLIARDRSILMSHDWEMVVLDEAQAIKNPNATTTRLIHEIKAQQRFCLTGTPMENHLGELWSLMNFVNPGFLGDKTAFSRNWRGPIEKRADSVRSKALANRIKPFVLRRTKAEVATELPPKTEIVASITLEDGQRAIYDSVRLAMHTKVRKAIAERGLAKSHIIILEALLKLRQVCCDPRLLKLNDGIERPSAQLERLMDMAVELLSEGRKILIFSQFTSMLALIAERFDQTGIAYSLLTGDTKDRKGAINDFQNGANDVFLVSLKAGGVGLNLTAADTVILYDPWWNPAVEEQAVDRAYRIGQDRPVFVYRLVAQGTIEEKMDELKARKRMLAEGLFDADGNPASALTEEDITSLFEA